MSQPRKIERLYLTDDIVARIQAPLIGETWFQDEAIPELRLKIVQKRRSWYYHKTARGEGRKAKLGEFPLMSARDARAVIEPMLKAAHFGEDPRSVLSNALLKRLPTYAEVFHSYLYDYLKVQKNEKEWTDAERSYQRCHLQFATKRVDDITRSEIQAWVNRLGVENGQSSANREFNRLRAALHYGERMQLYKFEFDPTAYITTFPEYRRERYLSKEEAHRLFAVLETKPQHQQDIVMMAVYTAARKGNILAAEWSEFDLENKIWKIPAHKAKAKKSIVLPLIDNALTLLDRRKNEGTDTQWVFPSLPDICGRKSGSGHVENFDKAWRKICSEAGLDDVHFHDLRHSVASWLGAQGANAFTIMSVLGHSSIVTTARYTHLNQDVARAAIESAHQKLDLSVADDLETVAVSSKLVSFASFTKRKASRTQQGAGGTES